MNYKENIHNGNMLVIDLAPLYISAMVGDIKPFDDARRLFMEKSRDRADRHVRFLGDGTGFLFMNKHFDECAMVEEWWQDRPFVGSYVCPFSKQSFVTFPHNIHAKRTIVSTHDSVIDFSATTCNRDHQHISHVTNEDKEREHNAGGVS